MSKPKVDKRIAEAEKKAKKVFDKIIGVYSGKDFVEIMATVGGDVIVRRYYDNGTECDK